MEILTAANGNSGISVAPKLPFWTGGVGVEGLYSSKSSLASPLSLLWVSRSLALIDKLKAAKHLMIKTKDFKSFNKLKKLKIAGPNSPTFLGTEAQHFRAFGTFGALGSPMGTQSQVAVSLFVRGGFEGPDRNQAQGLAVVTRADCNGKC